MTQTEKPTFRAALSNRTMQMTLGAFAFIAAAAGTALATNGGSINATDKAAIEQIVHNYILEHPEIIPLAVEKLQNKKTSSLIEANRKAIETPYAGAWEGAANGDVILVEYFDYACGYCRTSLPVLAKLVSEDKGLKVVYRELPILSENSGDAAKVSLLAAQRGKYMPYHEALYAAGRVTRDTIIAAAAKAGISKADAEGAIASHQYDAEIEGNLAVARKLQATGTPTFVVGDQVFNGAVGYDALKEAIAAARAK